MLVFCSVATQTPIAILFSPKSLELLMGSAIGVVIDVGGAAGQDADAGLDAAGV